MILILMEPNQLRYHNCTTHHWESNYRNRYELFDRNRDDLQ